MPLSDDENGISGSHESEGSASFHEMVRKGKPFSGNERNCAFLNLGTGKNGQPRFAKISGLSGVDFDDDGRAVATVDWDGDGDLDLWIRNRNAPQLRLLRNEVGNEQGHFLAIRLTGNGRDTNRDAIGARAEVFLRDQEGGRLVRTIRCGEGFLSQSSKWMQFGLGGGEAPVVEKIVVQWPNRSGKTSETFTGVKANTRVILRQGVSGAEELPLRDSSTIRLREEPVKLPGGGGTQRISSVTMFPWPGMKFRTEDGTEVDHSVAPGKWTLAMVWAHWCEACKAQMEALAEAKDELTAAEIEVIAVSADDLDGGTIEEGVLDGVKGAIEKVDFPFPIGFIDLEQMEGFQELNDFQTRMHIDIPVPTMFLIDPDQRIVSIHKGIASMEQILDDASESDRSLTDRRERAMRWGGTRIPSEAMREAEFAGEFRFHLHAGRKLAKESPETAIAYLKEALRCESDSVEARSLLVSAYLNARDLDAAGRELGVIATLPGIPAPQRAAAFYRQGALALQLGNESGAREAYRFALETDPNHVLALNELSRLLLKQAAPSDEERLEALMLAHRAVELAQSGQTDFIETPRAEQQASGESEVASGTFIKTLEEALRLAEGIGESELVEESRGKVGSESAKGD
ncbi:MAG: redoxin domain-containing protein [Verrucomicrobiota bacterium]